MLLTPAAAGWSQAIQLDGNQTTIVVIRGAAGGTLYGKDFIFRAKFVPEQLVLAGFTVTAPTSSFTPLVRCTLDPFSTDPIGDPGWQQVELVAISGSTVSYDSVSPALVFPTSSAAMASTPPMFCSQFAISFNAGTSTGTYTFLVRQVPTSTPISYIRSNTTNLSGFIRSGGVQLTGFTGGATPTIVGGSTQAAFPQDANGNFLKITGATTATTLPHQTNMTALGSSVSVEPLAVVTIPQYLSARINTAVSTVVKAGAGFIKRITVGVGGAGSTASVWNDSVAPCDVGQVANLSTVTSGTVYELEIAMGTGICVLTTATAPDIVVQYK